LLKNLFSRNISEEKFQAIFSTYSEGQHDVIYPAALPLNTGVSVKIFYLNKMCAKVCATELLVYLSFISE